METRLVACLAISAHVPASSSSCLLVFLHALPDGTHMSSSVSKSWLTRQVAWVKTCSKMMQYRSFSMQYKLTSDGLMSKVSPRWWYTGPFSIQSWYRLILACSIDRNDLLNSLDIIYISRLVGEVCDYDQPDLRLRSKLTCKLSSQEKFTLVVLYIKYQ